MANYTEPYHLYKHINDFTYDEYFNKKVQKVLTDFPTEVAAPTAALIKTILNYYLSYCTFTQKNWRSELTIDRFYDDEGTDISAVTTLTEASIKTTLTLLLGIFNKE